MPLFVVHLSEHVTTAKEILPLDKYSQSELANVVYTRGLAKYVSEITSVLIYPGDIKRGFLWRMGVMSCFH